MPRKTKERTRARSFAAVQWIARSGQYVRLTFAPQADPVTVVTRYSGVILEREEASRI